MDEATIDRIFIDYSIKKLRQQASRIQDCLAQLDDGKIWLRGSDAENAIGNLVLHLSGNVRQWIVSGIGGAGDIRVRDREFSTRGDVSKTELSERLSQTVDEAAKALAAVTAERMLDVVTIQGYEVTVMECIYHVVEHFSGHTGQIIYATKAVIGSDLGFHTHLRTAAAAHTEKTP